MLRLLLDTGPLVALANRRDQHHAWARAVFAQLPSSTTRLITCEAVLTETHYLIRKRGGTSSQFAALIRTLAPQMEPAWTDRTAALIETYAPRMDLADACLVALAERLPEATVLTTDRRDFSIYRTRAGALVPAISPDPA